MLRTVGDQPTLWETILPSAVLGMPEELERVDRLLDDPRFFEPYRSFFHERLGRRSIPIETYLRLMFLKYRYKLGFEMLCREVTDSITWQRFARISLGGRVPHPTTLMKITSRCGEAAVNDLNETLLVKAADARLLKTNRVRADTTVIEANVAYPSDSSLLATGVARMATAVKRLRATGLAARTRFADRTRAARKRAHSINANLRRRNDDKLVVVRRINAELAQIATRTVRQVDQVVTNTRRALRRLGSRASGKARALVDQLARTAERVAKIAEQCQQRIAGVTPDGATRIVSLHDPDARPIAKGRLGKPVEFGYKGQIIDNEDGVILDHTVEQGNPPDAPMLVPAITRITRRAGRPPRAVTADRGYGEQRVEDELREHGVRHVVLPRKGKPNAARRAVEQRRAFKKMVRWRTGSEGRISTIKRDYGCSRTRMDTLAGARTWTGHGIFAHNLVKIAALTK